MASTRSLPCARPRSGARVAEVRISPTCSGDDDDLVAAILMSTITIPASTSASDPSEERGVSPAPPPPTATRYASAAPCATETVRGESCTMDGAGCIGWSWGLTSVPLESPGGLLSEPGFQRDKANGFPVAWDERDARLLHGMPINTRRIIIVPGLAAVFGNPETRTD